MISDLHSARMSFIHSRKVERPLQDASLLLRPRIGHYPRFIANPNVAFTNKRTPRKSKVTVEKHTRNRKLMVTTRAKTTQASDKDDGSATKRMRVAEAAPSGLKVAHDESAMHVFAVELLTQKILTLLDAPSIVCFVAFLRSQDAWRGVLRDEKLWEELLLKHFGGHVPVPSPLQHEQQQEGDTSAGEDGYSDEEEDDEAVDEEDDEQDRDGTQSDGTSSNGVAAALAETADDSTPPPPATQSLETPLFACENLMHFVRSCRERTRFSDAVSVVEGDIGSIAEINGRALDGIAFATGGYLRNPYSGAAEVIFRRAGPELDRHVNELSARIGWGDVYVTPGFDAGVDKLIHCAGPSYRGHRCFPLLARTYESVMLAAVRENLQCLAMTSISTGNLGFPAQEAASTGLRALQNFIRAHSWEGTLAIVCFDTNVYDAFVQQKRRILDAFNVAGS